MIVREAGKFFRSCGVREKLVKEIAMVRHEAKAGRLKWTYDDVKSLIQQYPQRKADSVLKAMGDHYQLDEGDKPYEDEEAAVVDSDNESNWSEWNEPAAAVTESTNADAEEG